MDKNDALLPETHHINCEMHQDIEEDAKITSIIPMRRDYFKSFIYWVLVIMTLGIFSLLSFWWPRLKRSLNYRPCEVNKSSDILAISKYYESFTPLEKISTKSKGELLIFHYQELPYYFSGDSFVPLTFDSNLSFKDLIDKYGAGIENEELIEESRLLFGICLILVPIQPLFTMIVSEIFNPFYVFQLYSVLLWSIGEAYYTYALAIVVITAVSLIASIITTRKGQIALHKLAKKTCKIKVVRKSTVKICESTELVPGDLVEIDSLIELPCDLVLISGGCVVEEGVLTGESVPVIKDCISYLSDVVYDPDVDRRYTLYEGTKIIQTRNYSGQPVRAIVIRTGFKTVKGRLVRSIMYPKPNKFKFYEDSLKFIGVLALLTILGFIISIPRMVYLEYDNETMAIRVLDMITITVPPALPACMSAGVAFAISRLKKNKIYCISPNRVNVAGRIDLFVFDKTGTLTEDGMDLLGVQQAQRNTILELIQKPEPLSRLTECMATCHSLALIGEKLLGDTQDLQIFKAVEWDYEEPDNEKYDPIVKSVVRPRPGTENKSIFDSEGKVKKMINLEFELGILHIFHFTSKLKRMGVIAKNLNTQEVIFYSKGAPEVILEKCKEIPNDMSRVLANHTKKGHRVLACGYKVLENFKYTEINTLKIEDLEPGLDFIGIVVLQNKLKPATIPTLNTLNQAEIKTIMATGDAVLTGISVGRDCGIITPEITVYLGELDGSEITWQLFSSDDALSTKKLKQPPWKYLSFDDEYVLALTGSAFSYLINSDSSEEQKKVLQLILEKTQIYARMAPEHKTLLVEKLQSLHYLVGMCGDGANDCGALKTADIGVSLSEADSSIAAPFTSQVSDISSVLTVLREGRCALTTSIQCFKFMALYSMIQFTSVSIIYWFYSNMTNNQFMIIDLFTILPLSVLMSMTGSLDLLSSQQPPSELISFRIIFSVFLQAFLQAAFQCGSFLAAVWTYYEMPEVEKGVEPPIVNFQNTVVLFISWAEYQIVCATFSIGRPWKRPSYYNVPFTFFQVFIASVSMTFLFYENEWCQYLTDTVDLDFRFKLVLLGIIAGFAVFSYGIERVLVPCFDAILKKKKARKVFDGKKEVLNLRSGSRRPPSFYSSINKN